MREAPLHEPERIARELDWNLLRTFVVLAESRSVTDAASKLRLKQPTVSTALKRLESSVGRILIIRSPGQFTLTDAGRILYNEALEIHGSVLRLSTLMREMTDDVRGHVQISVASHVSCKLIDRVLADFHAAHPKVTMSIEVESSSKAIASVVAKRASFAICLVGTQIPSIEYRRVYREFFGLFCGPPHPLFGRDDLKLEDVAGHGSVSFETNHLEDVLKPVTLMRAQAALEQKVTGMSSHLEEVRRMVVAGLGIGPLPMHVASRDVKGGLLWQVPPFDGLPEIDVFLVWNDRANKNRAEEFLLKALLDAIETTPIAARTYR